jgi:hypothetical protein
MLISAGGGSQSGRAVVEKLRTIVVFEGATGNIRHVHHAVTFVGGTSLSDSELQERALKLARSILARTGKVAPTRLSVIQVEPSALTPGFRYRVDTKNNSLVVAHPSSKRKVSKTPVKRRTTSKSKSKRR